MLWSIAVALSLATCGHPKGASTSPSAESSRQRPNTRQSSNTRQRPPITKVQRPTTAPVRRPPAVVEPERPCLGLPERVQPEPPPPGRNLLGGPLAVCSTNPVTGWFRDGRCRTGPRDRGRHTVCATMTREFLKFTAARGNDLSTPSPRYGFAGLRPGDRWCLCAARWAEADKAGVAPRPVLEATDAWSLRVVAMEKLRRAAGDSPAQ